MIKIELSIKNTAHILEAQLLKIIPIAVARKRLKNNKEQQSTDLKERRKTLYIDISVFSNRDAGTGIQRVVREVLYGLISDDDTKFDITPIAATKHGLYQAIEISGKKSNITSGALRRIVKPKYGDVFLGLDLTAHILPKNYPELLNWKRNGVSIQMVVYDLLPALHPEWFNKKATKNFKKWLRTIATFADRYHCISKTVSIDLIDWLRVQYKIIIEPEAIKIFPLGSNLEFEPDKNSRNPTEVAENVPIFNFVRANPTTLMVGTIEPRKGYLEVLRVFNELWSQGSKEQLLIVGKPGWKTDELQQILSEASMNITEDKPQSKLMWLKEANDSTLIQLYRKTNGVIAASEGEGYGLPLIEARYFNKSVFARDIAVFRETALDNVTFFPDKENTTLTAEQLNNWLQSNHVQQSVNRNNEVPSWQNSIRILRDNIQA